jgi:hypothetical protein
MDIIKETPDGEGTVCTLLAVDIAGFGRRDDDMQCHLRRALYRLLRQAFRHSGIPWADCVAEDRGDGALFIIPSSVPTLYVMNRFPETLAGLLGRYNQVWPGPAQIRLRAAAHVGYVVRDQHGIVGYTVVHLFRMLDAEPLRQLLADSRADLAFAVSGYVFDAIVSRHPALIDPGLFRPLPIEVKETNTLAWVRLAGGGLQGVKTIRPVVSPAASRCSPAGTSSSPSRWLTSGLIAPSATSLVSRAWQSLMS